MTFVGGRLIVHRIDLESGEISVLSKHSEPVRRVVYCPNHCTSGVPLPTSEFPELG